MQQYDKEKSDDKTAAKKRINNKCTCYDKRFNIHISSIRSFYRTLTLKKYLQDFFCEKVYNKNNII